MDKAEQNRVEAEEGRVEAEDERRLYESNDEFGRREAEENRVHAEEGRVKAQEARVEYETELDKLRDDPDHYVTPGARRYFRRVALGYIVLAAAFVAGVWAIDQEGNNRVKEINISRATISYENCLEVNARNDAALIKLNAIYADRELELEHAYTETEDPLAKAKFKGQIEALKTNKQSTIGLVNALVPNQDCDQIVMERFGVTPNELQQGGE
jgi:hypothetical protein